MSARSELRFYCGLHQPGDAKAFERAFISINRLRGRRKTSFGFERCAA